MILGYAIWFLALPLRELKINFNPLFQLFIDTAPNIGVSLAFPFICLLINDSTLLKKSFDEKKVFYSSLIILPICLLISEIIHELFLNSPIDIYDLLASLLVILLDIIIFYKSRKIFIARNN